MSRAFRDLIERQIKAAEARGELQGLAGSGKPLPSRPEEAVADPAMLSGFRIMAEAGAVPEEIRLKKMLEFARAAYAQLPDGADKKSAMREIADLSMRYDMAVEARKKFFS